MRGRLLIQSSTRRTAASERPSKLFHLGKKRRRRELCFAFVPRMSGFCLSSMPICALFSFVRCWNRLFTVLYSYWVIVDLMVFVCGSQLYHVCYGFYFFPISCYTIFIRNIRFRLQCTKKCCIIFERLAEMAELVEGARLEIVFTGNRNKGSNPFLCAKQKSTQ